MRKFNWVFAGLLIWLSIASTYAQTSEKVCGIALDEVAVFNFDQFRDGRGAQAFRDNDRELLYAALKRELESNSLDWPINFAVEVFKRFKELELGVLTPADWARTEAERPEESLNFQGVVFGGDDKRIWLPAEANEDECAESDAMKKARAQFALFADLTERSVAELTGPTVNLIARRLAVIEQQYDTYLFEGFPMYPWEAAVNSWFLTDAHIANGPPRWQLALFHPSAGVTANAESGTDGDMGATLLVEPVGVVRYTRDYKHWYGASLVASFPFDREPGYGFALTYDQFKIGVTWHNDADKTHDGMAVFIGLELRDLIGRKKSEYDGYKNRVKELFHEVQAGAQ